MQTFISVSRFCCVTMLSMLGLCVDAQERNSLRFSAENTQITVHVTGKARSVPDIALLRVQLLDVSAKSNDALQLNAARTTRLLALIQQLGISDDDIQTQAVMVYPQQRDHEPGTNKDRLVYQVRNMLQITVRHLDALGHIMQQLVQQGANQVDGPDFQLSHVEDILDRARVQALDIAQKRCNAYASALQLKVKRILSISEASQNSDDSGLLAGSFMRSAAAPLAAPMPVAPGTIMVQTDLELTCELARW